MYQAGCTPSPKRKTANDTRPAGQTWAASSFSSTAVHRQMVVFVICHHSILFPAHEQSDGRRPDTNVILAKKHILPERNPALAAPSMAKDDAPTANSKKRNSLQACKQKVRSEKLGVVEHAKAFTTGSNLRGSQSWLNPTSPTHLTPAQNCTVHCSARANSKLL